LRRMKHRGFFVYISLTLVFTIIVLAYTYQYNRVLSLSYDIERAKEKLTILQVVNDDLKKDLENKIIEYAKANYGDLEEVFDYPGREQLIWIVMSGEK